MTPTAVIVPVKSAERKSRLSGLMTKLEREEFARLLLAEVLRAITSAGLLGLCYVVSPDKEMLDLAGRMGSRTVVEPSDMGVNSAVSRGLRVVRGKSNVLVIPADLPLLRPSELKHLLAIKSIGVGAVIAPSHDFDGTNALLFSGSAHFPLSYDDNSFWNHLGGAAANRLSVGVCTDQGLMFDVDSPKDFSALALSGSSRRVANFARMKLR